MRPAPGEHPLAGLAETSTTTVAAETSGMKIGEIVSARASVRLTCDYCGRIINWPHHRLQDAFHPEIEAERAWRRLRCKRCMMRGEVLVDVLMPIRRS